MISQMTLTREARDSLRWSSSTLLNGRSLIRNLPTQAVGCSIGPDVHPGCVDGLRQAKTYLFPGIEHCFVCSSTLATHTETQDSVTSSGQHNSGCLPIEGRGHAERICESAHHLAAEILTLASQHKILLHSSYLPGLMNTQADALSRSKEPDEWMLAPIVARFSQPTVFRRSIFKRRREASK